MARTPNVARRQNKREAILESARNVFCRKGFNNVTMKDIIEECGISRGGIYLYFKSVDDIFIEVVNQRNSHKFEDIRKSVKEGVSFPELLDSYFVTQKNRLLHMEESMLRSMYEYFFTHKSAEDRKFQQAQLEHVKSTIMEILTLGVHQGILRDENINSLAENFMFLIEGLSVLALIGSLTEDRIDAQFSLIKVMLPLKSK
ncbi:TetR/AcrR family transcriptional regulator [Ornithinibacillus xuwenensis]|jgi:AcrR family transcriptional regulator|uniref:TetR/AcrR family transcriptional regulator n=1 Tax=Ornithinibacillus xuwenensis TaxID=3144668 RepID=A0ABU9XJN1_9BACI